MNCQKASNHLSAYLDRELLPEERRLLRLHLIACTECTDEMQQIEEIKTALGRLSVFSVPSVIPWLRAQLAATRLDSPPPELIWQYPWFRRTCAAAALLLLFGLSSWLLSPQRQNTSGRDNPAPALPLPDASWIRSTRIMR